MPSFAGPPFLSRNLVNASLWREIWNTVDLLWALILGEFHEFPEVLIYVPRDANEKGASLGLSVSHGPGWLLDTSLPDSNILAVVQAQVSSLGSSPGRSHRPGGVVPKALGTSI